MAVEIRAYGAGDEEGVVALALRAFAPVFASLEAVLGPELSARLHGEWRVYQADAVRRVLADEATTTWVAVLPGADGGPAGFAATRVADARRRIGEVDMLAVDPPAQGRGVGSALTAYATGRLRDAGMRVAMIETGGDPGHAPARRTYEKAGYTALPIVRYFTAL